MLPAIFKLFQKCPCTRHSTVSFEFWVFSFVPDWWIMYQTLHAVWLCERVSSLFLVLTVSPFVYTPHEMWCDAHIHLVTCCFLASTEKHNRKLTAWKHKKARDRNSQLMSCYAGSTQRGVWIWIIMNTFPPLMWDLITSLMLPCGALVSHFEDLVE